LCKGFSAAELIRVVVVGFDIDIDFVMIMFFIVMWRVVYVGAVMQRSLCCISLCVDNTLYNTHLVTAPLQKCCGCAENLIIYNNN